MKRTLQVLNELELGGVIDRYAIGGAMGATFYVEPLLTFDLDVFVILPQSVGGLLSLAPLYEALHARGYPEEGECVFIEGVGPVSSCLQSFAGRGAEGGARHVIRGSTHESSPGGTSYRHLFANRPGQRQGKSAYLPRTGGSG